MCVFKEGVCYRGESTEGQGERGREAEGERDAAPVHDHLKRRTTQRGGKEFVSMAGQVDV